MPKQNAETVHKVLTLTRLRGQLSSRCRGLCFRPYHIECRAYSCLEAYLGQVPRLLLGRQIGLGDGHLLLHPPDLNIVPRDLSQQGNQYGTLSLDCRLNVRFRSFDSMPYPTKEIDFPARSQSAADGIGSRCYQLNSLFAGYADYPVDLFFPASR